MDRRSFCVGACVGALAIFAANGVLAHPDHRKNDLFIDVLVSRGADRVEKTDGDI